MPRSTAQRVKRLFLVLAFLAMAVVLLHALLTRLLHHVLRERIQELAVRSGANWVDSERTAISIDVLAGDLRIVDLHWESTLTENRVQTTAAGRVDTLQLRGLSYVDLLMNRRLTADELALFAVDIDLRMSRDTAPVRNPGSGPPDLRLGMLEVHIRNASVSLPDSTNIAATDLRLDGGEIMLDMSLREFAASHLHGSILGIRATPFADSLVHVASIELDGMKGAATLENITFGPANVVERARGVALERDVLSGSISSLDLRGLDMDALLGGVLTIRAVQLGPTDLIVARDKVLTDPPFQHKPLPARSLRAMPLGAGADSLIVESLQVDYHERVDVARGFAHIAFDSIAGVLTGLHNVPEDTMRLMASGLVFGRTPVVLDLHSHIGDSSDHFVAEARVGRLAFAQLTNALAPLTGVATPAGRLDTLILRMNGRDARATARCWMRYDGLKLDLRGQKNKALDPVLNGLLNVIVKRGRTGEKDGEGWEDYAWDRRRDRSVFNYLWAGVREGAKTSMLPKAVVDQVSKR